MGKLYLWWFPVAYCTLLAVVIATAGGPFSFAARLGTQALKQHYSETADSKLTDQICKVIRADLKYYSTEGLDHFDGCQIEKITSATGDGAKTMLADIGGLGAYTDAIVVYRINLGAVIAAKFKDRKGRVSRGGLFAQGSSAMNSADVILSPNQHAIFTLDLIGIKEDGSSENCDVYAYQWNPKLGMYVERTSRKTDEVQCDHVSQRAP